MAMKARVGRFKVSLKNALKKAKCGHILARNVGVAVR